MDKNCKFCGKSLEGIENIVSGKYCSYKCYEKWSRDNKEPNCSCVICGKQMYLKPSRIKRAVNGITCSKDCANKLKAIYMKGENNHQYGLTGDKNSSFAGDVIVSNYGYLLEYCPGHPYPHDRSNKTVRVLQHRLVIERNYKKFSPEYFEEVDGMIVLKQCYEVHHKNENKQDNRLENLEILTKSEHISYHNSQKEILRDNLGRIVGVVKSGNIGEGLTANPEINSGITQGLESSYSVESE